MEIKIDFDEELYKKVKNITITNYYMEGNMLPLDSLPIMIEDLIYEYELLKEEFEDFKEDVRENYKLKSNLTNYEYEDYKFAKENNWNDMQD